MAPVLNDGDIIQVESACEGARLELGDIVLCRGSSGNIFAHRLVAWKREGEEKFIVTKADAVPICDPPVRMQAVLGRVAIIERDGKKVSLGALPSWWLNRLQGWLSYTEAVAWQRGRQVKRRLMKDRPSPLAPIAMRIVRFPFKICAKLQDLTMR